MKKKKDLWWNSLHSSPEVIKNFLKTKSIADLIEFMDICYEVAKREEAKEYFYAWNPNEEPEQASYRFVYEDALKKIQTVCSVIVQKRTSMHHYCVWSPKRECYHKLADEITEYIKKIPDITYNELVEKYGEDAIIALDYLIEADILERRGNVESNYWKTKECV